LKASPYLHIHDSNKNGELSYYHWIKVGDVFQDWSQMPGNKVRDKYIHGYGVILSSIGLLGRYLLEEKLDFEKLLPRLNGLNWSKWKIDSKGVIQTNEEGKRIGNPFWNGFAMNGSTVQNTTTNIRHTTMLFRKQVGMLLSEDENVEFDLVKSGSTL
jgi:hypothetical protein